MSVVRFHICYANKASYQWSVVGNDTFAGMLVFPPAKINLGLRVLGKRPDGYHDLETIFIPIGLYDMLEIKVDEDFTENSFKITYSGLSITGDPCSDLVRKAILGVQKTRVLPGLRVHLHKAIPMGAGLGGGSSDAASTLRAINSLLKLGMAKEEMEKIALELGSDVPFFLHDGAMLGQGRGERLSRVKVDLAGWWLVLIDPGVHVSTAEAFRKAIAGEHTTDPNEVIKLPVKKWKKALVNDLEGPVFSMHPALAEWKEQLYAHGAAYASMSGSGSSIYGIFKQQPTSLRNEGSVQQQILPL